MTRRTVVAAAPARVHLAGNPSDGYGGAVLSTTLTGFAATVTLTEAASISISGPDRRWSSIDELLEDVATRGHEGGDRLVTAALATVGRHAGTATSAATPFAVTWSTTIPRSVGLAGSSAIVLATIEAASTWWAVDVDAPARARLALRAETEELGVGAGIADRFAQAIGGVVLTDARRADPAATSVPVGGDIPIAVCWKAELASPSGRYHRDLRQRFEAREPATLSGIDRLGALADQAAAAVRAGDVAGLADAASQSLATRIAMGSVEPALVDAVDELCADGVGVNFAGSGGAFVVVPAPDPHRLAELQGAGWTVAPVPLEVGR